MAFPENWYNDATEHFRLNREADKHDAECDVLEWLANCDFELIDDSQIEIFRDGCVDVLHSNEEWVVRAHTDDKARLIRYEARFSISTPSAIVIKAIKESIYDCYKNRKSLDSHTDER